MQGRNNNIRQLVQCDRKKNVRFNEAVEVRQEEQFDTKQFRELLWFSKAEYSAMSKEASKDVQKVLNGEYIEDVDQCVRGLEKLYHGRCHEIIDLSIILLVNERNRICTGPKKRVSISELYQEELREDDTHYAAENGRMNAYRSFFDSRGKQNNFPSNASKRKKNVRFNDVIKYHQEEQFDTKDFKELLWFSKDEYSAMSKEASEFVQKVLNGEYIEDVDQCVRGLEKLYNRLCNESIDLSIVLTVNERNLLCADSNRRVLISELYEGTQCEDEPQFEATKHHNITFRNFVTSSRKQKDSSRGATTLGRVASAIFRAR